MPNSRLVFVDTETTGLSIEEDHRIIEIGCVGVENFQLTGSTYHTYLNPEREIDADAVRIHGKSLQDLKSEPRFGEIANDFLNFIQDTDVVIHNASFDVEFLNYELQLAGRNEKIGDICNVIDSLDVARKKHTQQYNNLDALCKRYNVDTSSRHVHGALVDAELLARVYIKMTAGEVSLFSAEDIRDTEDQIEMSNLRYERERTLVVRATDEEMERHNTYMKAMAEQNSPVE